MSDVAFGTYSKETEKMTEAARGANDCLARLAHTFGPLLTKLPNGSWNWRGCYLTGITQEIPAALIRRNHPGAQERTAIDVSNVHACLEDLMTYMARYAEAQEAAATAYNQIPSQQRQLLAPPPWQVR